jgi:hypothetical protein
MEQEEMRTKLQFENMQTVLVIDDHGQDGNIKVELVMNFKIQEEDIYIL